MRVAPIITLNAKEQKTLEKFGTVEYHQCPTGTPRQDCFAGCSGVG